MPSKRAYILRDSLLSGELPPAGLESALATPSALADFRVLTNNLYAVEPLLNTPPGFDAITGSETARSIILNSRAALSAAAQSDFATQRLCTLPAGALMLAHILKDPTGGCFSAWRDINANYKRIKNMVNAHSSKLKRAVFKSSGTWEMPVGGVLALSVAAVGGGQGGSGTGGSASSWPAPGGAGGQTVVQNLLTLPTTDQSVSIGAGGAGKQASGSSGSGATGGATSFGAYVTAVGGGGSGNNTEGGWRVFTDVDLQEAVFQVITASQSGGAGGSDGLPNTAGRAAYTNPNTSATGGHAYSGGGGQGTSAATIPGSSAASNSGGGGGGASAQNGLASGGNGGTGILIVYWLEV